MIRQTDIRCNICGWELFANCWNENHGDGMYEPMMELYCRNGCEFNTEKEYIENAEED